MEDLTLKILQDVQTRLIALDKKVDAHYFDVNAQLIALNEKFNGMQTTVILDKRLWLDLEQRVRKLELETDGRSNT